MPDLFDVSTSALLAFKQAINTTGNNIANINTEGYSRQVSTLASLPGQLQGSAYYGGGVSLQSVERAYDQFLSESLRAQTSAQAASRSYYQIAERADALLADSGAGVDEAMNDFFNAWQSLANNPSGRAERTSLLAQAESMLSRFQSLDGTLAAMTSEVNQRIESSVNEINELAETIAQLNTKIIRASSGTTGQPNTLLDQRDLAITSLAELVSVSVTPQSDGSVNISVGKGQALVVGESFSSLDTRKNEFSPEILEVGYAGSTGTISSMLNGGELGGLLSVRDQLVEPARQQLGLLATAMTELVNEQHNSGLDLNGELGGDMFTSPVIIANPSSVNSGTAEIRVSQLTAQNLTLSSLLFSFDGNDWTMLDETTGATSLVSFPLSYNGMQVELSGVASSGDRFRLEPYSDAISTLDLAIQDTDDIAAAAPLSSLSGGANLGTLQITDLSVNDNSILPLSAPISFVFDEDAMGPGLPGFHVSGATPATLAYDSDNPISIAGIEIQFEGEPVAGDSFEILTSGVYGDNRNALSIAALQEGKYLMGDSVSPTDIYGDLVSEVASRTRQSEMNLQAESALLEQSQTAQASVSGVNLDEEAARLVQLQQAYQAAAQMVTVADELFQTLLNAMGR